MQKKTLVFVVDTLANHGAERYLYEILKTLDKELFDCTVYSIRNLSGFELHYLKLIEDLGIRVIIEKNEIFRNIKFVFFRRLLSTLAYRFVSVIRKNYVKQKLQDEKFKLLSSYDLVAVIKWEVYLSNRLVFDDLPKKIIHILSLESQYSETPFTAPPKKPTTFVLMSASENKNVFPQLQQDKYCEDYKFNFLPLLIDKIPSTSFYNPCNNEFRIGIFSRISQDQPTLFILYLLHYLKYNKIEVKVYFYGKSYSQSFLQFYIQTAKNLRVNDLIEFKGHTFNINESIKNDGLSLGVMNSASAFIGYSSIELICAGLPILFFNIDYTDFDSLEENVVVGLHNSLESLLNELIELYKNPQSLNQHAAKQKEYVEKHHLSFKHKDFLNKLFLES